MPAPALAAAPDANSEPRPETGWRLRRLRRSRDRCQANPEDQREQYGDGRTRFNAQVMIHRRGVTHGQPYDAGARGEPRGEGHNPRNSVLHQTGRGGRGHDEGHDQRGADRLRASNDHERDQRIRHDVEHHDPVTGGAERFRVKGPEDQLLRQHHANHDNHQADDRRLHQNASIYGQQVPEQQVGQIGSETRPPADHHHTRGEERGHEQRQQRIIVRPTKVPGYRQQQRGEHRGGQCAQEQRPASEECHRDAGEHRVR